MKRSRIILFFTFMLILSVGKFWGDALRGEAVAVMSPFWKGVGAIKEMFSNEKRGNQAKVIYRTPSLWHSALWIDQGEGDVELHSPVVKGSSLVGVVDYVGKKQSRVRLITDSNLTPAVRVSRGLDQSRKIVEDTKQLMQDLAWFGKEELGSINKECLAKLSSLVEAYTLDEERHLLA
jgi:hypothetical protein